MKFRVTFSAELTDYLLDQLKAGRYDPRDYLLNELSTELDFFNEEIGVANITAEEVTEP